MMTSSSFNFRVYLKNIFALEPLLKLETFVVEEEIYQNVKEKVKKIISRCCNRRRQKRGLKTGNFFQNRYLSHINFSKNMFKDFFRIQRHQMII
jgi:hypothetical protein